MKGGNRREERMEREEEERMEREGEERTKEKERMESVCFGHFSLKSNVFGQHNILNPFFLFGCRFRCFHINVSFKIFLPSFSSFSVAFFSKRVRKGRERKWEKKTVDVIKIEFVNQIFSFFLCRWLFIPFHFLRFTLWIFIPSSHLFLLPKKVVSWKRKKEKTHFQSWLFHRFLSFCPSERLSS